MAFMSMVIVGIVLIILAIGFVNLLIGLILDIVWIVKAKKQKKMKAVTKVFAVITSVIGIILFVLPVAIGLIGGFSSQIAKTNKFNGIENKTYVSDDYSWFEDGFEYKGILLCPVDFITRTDDVKEKEPDGAVVINEDKYYDIYTVDNEQDFTIYYVDQVNESMYCAADEYDDIYDYYYNEADLDATISEYDDNDGYHVWDCKFDKDTFFHIKGYYDTRQEDVYVTSDQIDLDYTIEVKSKDGCFVEMIFLYEIGDQIMLGSMSSGGNHSGFSLSEEEAEYVREVVREYTDIE